MDGTVESHGETYVCAVRQNNLCYWRSLSMDQLMSVLLSIELSCSSTIYCSFYVHLIHDGLLLRDVHSVV